MPQVQAVGHKVKHSHPELLGLLVRRKPARDGAMHFPNAAQSYLESDLRWVAMSGTSLNRGHLLLPMYLW